MVPDSLDRRFVGGILVTSIAVIVSLLTASALPAQLTTRWDAAGRPVGTMARSTVLIGAPALVFGVVLLFEVIPRFSSLAGDIESFQLAYDAFALLSAGFLVYIHVLVVVWNLGYRFPIEQGLIPAVAVLFVAVGSLVERAEPNWFIGIRTPWTLSSATVWRRTHQHAGRLCKLAGVSTLGGLIRPEHFASFIAVPAGANAVITTVYSYVAYHQLDGNGH